MPASRRQRFALLALVLLCGLLTWQAGERVARTRSYLEGDLAASREAGASRSARPVSTVLAAEKWVPMERWQPGQVRTFPDAKFTNRFRNTSSSLDEMVRNDRALNLRNALVDTANGVPLQLPAGLEAGEEPGAYVVQSHGVLGETLRRQLRDAGLEIVSYIPNNAYLVRGTRSAMELAAGSPEVAAVLPFAPAFKLEPQLLDRALAASPTPGNQQLIVTVSDPAKTVPDLIALGGTEVFRERGTFGQLVTVSGLGNRLIELAQLPGVLMIEQWTPRALANDLTGVALGSVTNLDNTGPYLELDGSGVLVNINDSGVDKNHPDLVGRVDTIPALAATVLADLEGHGTHVAGTIAGDGSASGTLAGTPQGSTNGASVQGRTPKAKLFVLPVDLIQGPPSGDTYLQEEAAKAPGRSSRNRPLISNNSWGYTTREYSSKSASYDAAVRDALPGERGDQPILYVFSAGNEGSGGNSGVGGIPDSITSPGNAKNVITVGAVESPRFLTNAIVYDTNFVAVKIGSTAFPDRGYVETNTTYFTNEVLKPFTDTAHQVAGFSSRGNVGVEIEGSSGRFKPDVVAPGSFILSARSSRWRIEDQYPADPLTGEFPDSYYLFGELEKSNAPSYRFESGTSMSAPAISGLLAQIQQYFEQKLNVFPSAATYKALLINASRATSQIYEPDTKEAFNYGGWGMPTLPRALRSGIKVAGNDKPLAAIEGAGLSTAEAATLKLTLSETNAPLRISLVWTDPPGNPAASTKLVNDLDLVISNTVSGEVFFGNDFSPGTGVSQAQTTNEPVGPDRVNNVERIVLQSPSAGEYVVWVIAHRVNVNARRDNPAKVAQDFSLVIGSDAEVADGNSAGEVDDLRQVDAVSPGIEPPTKPVGITNGVALFYQKAGAHSPLIGDQRGTTNQWRFFTLTNRPFTNFSVFSVTTNGTSDESITNYLTSGSNVAFVVFPSLPDANLSRTRTNGPDLDLYVSRDPGLLTLDPVAVAGAAKSRDRGATELLTFTNVPLGDDVVFYVGVKSEDQQAGEFALIGLSTDEPFTSLDENGFPHPLAINLRPLEDGTPSDPGVGQWLAISLISQELRRVTPTVSSTHENFRDLLGELQLRSQSTVLNNHGPLLDLSFGTNVYVRYDDSGSGDYSRLSNTRPSDGPGTLNEFMGLTGGGAWFFNSVDNAFGNAGAINYLDLQLMPNDFGAQFVERCVRARRIELEVINIPADATRLTITLTNRQGETLDGPLEIYVRREAFPDLNNPDNNDKYATVFPPGGGELSISIRDVPPLTSGRYFVAVYNPNAFEVCYRIRARVERGLDGRLTKSFESGIINLPITDHAVTYSAVTVDDSRPVTAIGAGLRIEHPRLSDLSIRLINPQGDSTVLVENRGRTNATAFGRELITTNGVFAHVALTFERSSGRAQIYVNGLRVAEQNFVDFLPDSTNSLRFGTDGTTGNATPVVLDDFGLWRRTLTADNIRDIYRYGVEDGIGKGVYETEAGLVALWPFDGAGTELVDGKDVALAGSLAATGLIGQAISLAGTGTVPAPEPGQPLDVAREAGFTLEGWVNVGTNDPVIIAGWSGTNGHVGPVLVANYPPPVGKGPGSFSLLFTNIAVLETNATNLRLASAGGLVTPGATVTNTLFAVFSEITNLNSQVIKFAEPPFVTDSRSRLIAASSFDGPRTGDQFFTVGELVDGWTVVSNTVQWDFFPEDALTGTSCIEMFPNLGGGAGSRIRRTFATVPGRFYTLSVGYRRVPLSPGPASPVFVFADGVQVSTFSSEDTWQTNASVVQATTNTLTFDIANPAGEVSPSRMATAVASVDNVGRITGVTVVDGGAGYVTAPAVRFQVIGLPIRGSGGAARAEIENGAVARIVVVRPGTNYLQAPRVVVGAPPTSPRPAPTFLDEIRFVEEPSGVYVPEEPLRPLAKGSAVGQWRLEVADSRAGEVGELLKWQMELTFAPTNLPAFRLTQGVPFTTNVAGSSITYFIVEVPPEVYAATNSLVSVTGGPLDLLYSQTGLPDGLQTDDYYLLNGVQNVEQSATLLTNVLPQLRPGQRYYLGVQNSLPGQNNTFTIRVDFGLPITVLTNDVAVTATNANKGMMDYYSFDVSPDALGVRFSVSNLTGDVNLVVRQGPNLPTRNTFDYASTNVGLTPESIEIDPLSLPVPLSPGTWYLGVYPSDSNRTKRLVYTIHALEAFANVAALTNGVPVNGGLTNNGVIDYYYIDITNQVSSLALGVTNLSGNADLFVRAGLPLPTAVSFDFASTNSGTADEVIVLSGDRTPQLLNPGRWFLAVVPRDPLPVTYTVLASFSLPDNNARLLLDSVPQPESVVGGPTNLLYRFEVAFDFTSRILFELYGLDGDADLFVSKDNPPDQNATVLRNIKPGLANEVIVANEAQFPQMGGTWFVQVRLPAATTNAAAYTVRAATRQNGRLISGIPTAITYNFPTAAGQTPYITWNAVPGELYQVQTTADLSATPLVWQPEVSPAVVTGDAGLALVPFVDVSLFPTYYYRVIQIPNP
jgi:subtilisin-like proprotein convertase family protein